MKRKKRKGGVEGKESSQEKLEQQNKCFEKDSCALIYFCQLRCSSKKVFFSLERKRASERSQEKGKLVWHDDVRG